MKKEGPHSEKKEQGENLDTYVHEHIRSYTSYMLRQGYPFDSIENCLLHYGYKKKQIDKILSGINKEHKVSKKGYKIEDLDKETYYYMRAILAEYIKKQMEHGYKPDEIMAALTNYGHDKKLVKDSFSLIGKKVTFKAPVGATFFFAIIFLVGFVFLLGLMIREEPQIVAMSFAPAAITICIIYGLLSVPRLQKYRTYFPILAILIALIVYMLLINLFSQYDMEYGVILALNAVGSFMLSMFMVLFSKGR